ncbi:hypothetical protein TH53_05740 [Pedobacter lusitanus]|uniref:Uncharacterized protein n=1 Tax=Pedobacter lusitanus TaxID=1503925 RepID=A0A0D0F8N4_9SPHI|nr:hypothetical protein [Pedobacter lusitanus]KIO78093.1 hypothetical protein TH53_05740 [Pedobacter lusitanus]
MCTQGVIQLIGKPVNEKQAAVSFNLLPGSDPVAMGCFLSIWEGSRTLSSSEALQTRRINSGELFGDHIFDKLSIGKKNYIVGLGIDKGRATETIVATLSLGVSAILNQPLPAVYSNISVNADNIGTDFLIAHFASPCCNQIKANKKWIALFQGEFNSAIYNGTNMIATSKAAPYQYSGSIIMKNIPKGLARFETYTLIFGQGLDKFGDLDYTKLISSCTFIVWRSKIYIGASATSPFSASSPTLINAI